MSSKKSKQFDRAAAISFFVDFCAIFSLILIVGLLTAANSFGGASGGAAALSRAMGASLNCSCPAPTDCGFSPIAPAVLFPASSPQPLEAALEISIDEGGFSSRELNLSFSSSRTLRVTNKGVRNHSLAIDALGLNSGIIVPGQSVTVVLENSGDREREMTFYSDMPGDTGENFWGTITFE